MFNDIDEFVFEDIKNATQIGESNLGKLNTIFVMSNTYTWLMTTSTVTDLLWHIGTFAIGSPLFRAVFTMSQSRTLCRTKLLPVTHVLVDTRMSTVKPVYKLKMCLMTWNGLQTHMWHHLHSLLRHSWQYLVLEDLFCSFIFLPVHHPSTHISTRPQWFLPVQMMGGRVSA